MFFLRGKACFMHFLLGEELPGTKSIVNSALLQVYQLAYVLDVILNF